MNTTNDKPMRPEEIAGIMCLAHPFKVRSLLGCCKISFAAIAKRKGCHPSNVTLVFSEKYRMPSMPVFCTAYEMLQEALGDLCPDFDAVFDIKKVDIQQEAANG